MKRLSLILFLLLSLPTLAPAMEWPIPLKDLVCDSDLIVIGTLSSVNEYSMDGTDYGEGMIIVEETIWGAVNPGESLILKWANESRIVCPRVEYGLHADDFLPGRVFVSEDIAPVVVGAKQERRISIDLRQVFDINAPAPYTFRFKIRGFDRGNDCEFYFKPTERLAGNDSEEPKNAETKTMPVYKIQLALWPALGIIGALGFFSLYRRRAQK